MAQSVPENEHSQEPLLELALDLLQAREAAELAILARRQRGESIRTIAAGGKVSIGVVHKTLTDARQEQQP